MGYFGRLPFAWKNPSFYLFLMLDNEGQTIPLATFDNLRFPFVYKYFTQQLSNRFDVWGQGNETKIKQQFEIVLGISLVRSGPIFVKKIVDRFNQFVCSINFRCLDFFLICAMLPHLLGAFPLLISRLSLKYCRLATLMALFVSYLFLSPSGVTLSDILYLKHPHKKETTLSVILHFSTGSINCYQNPNNDSSVPIKIKCSFPENLCFKFDKKREDNEQVTIQGCISADQCRQFDDQHLQCCEGDLCNNGKCHGYTNAKIY